ncbi:MAG TPA: peptide-methionine (S)-S-oxide reductase MsrA [Candidatus Saccharimonadales bacterium]|nr:peptide-methionine (S)-S-oxide reductase MsrA [Candidatus Saccharimonadales bacterium]
MANLRTAYLAGGCFWGLEELFREQSGVIDTEVGYSGGKNDNPTYENHPGHAETLAIAYDTTKTTYTSLLDFFFRIHDPTTKDRQGNDIGSSYRSAVFYQNDDELEKAKDMIYKVNASKLYRKPVVTTLEPFKKFWTAEEYHQDYLRKHPGGYTCHYVRTDESLLK